MPTGTALLYLKRRTSSRVMVVLDFRDLILVVVSSFRVG